MPSLSPPAPVDWQHEAYRVLVGILQSDPMLKARNIRWACWTGDPSDPSTRNPTEAECPFVRVTLLGGGRAERHGTDGDFNTYRLPLTVQIAHTIAGTDAREATQLSALIYGALWPNPGQVEPDDPRAEALRAARQAIDARWRSVGVSDVFLRVPILPTDYYQMFIASVGEIELWQFVNL